MANEIWHNYPSGNKLDAYVFKKTDDKVFDENDGGDTFEAWVDGNVLNYDVPMTDHDGDYYSVDFPAVIVTAGRYRTVVAVRAGANAAVGDRRIAQGEIHWDGTAEMDITTLDALLDGVITDLNKTNNIYDETGGVTTPTITSTGRLTVAEDC